ncbi:hypothetical protein [Burkholderia sp. PAMC 26561]|uniref:hypothetical protein n=1 Tax=Burkholderia sp. PAMC 26561 TaxID=1795043 RepID=UPI00076B3FCE|nr:hypothetical protein [Burkholderia sp. PAMC 26561]AME28653.1 hypothetical protein AXG89_33225 [Burkholderia sp. PAMC 26561]
MNDKKDYINVLKALDRTGPMPTAMNQLSEVAVATEDEKLRTALEGICAMARQQLAPIGAQGRLLGISPQSFPTLHQAFGKLAKYCEQQRDASEKQWEILARRAGWTPPNSTGG